MNNLNQFKTKVFFYIALLFVTFQGIGQSIIPLYSESTPNSVPHLDQEYQQANELVDSLTFKVSQPTLKVFLPEKNTGKSPAVIICPGGGYGVLLTKREGSDVAKAFQKQGIAAFVLKYRIPDSTWAVNPSIAPLQDVQQALFRLRKEADSFGIDPDKIGVIGFSAGGHLAASSGVHNAVYYVDSTERETISPDFMILINPVISFKEDIGHLGSRKNLLGSSPTDEEIAFFSLEDQVDAATPPTLLIHNNTDSVVLVDNSLAFYQALRTHQENTALHIYGRGEHGFLTWPHFDEWFPRCIYWMHGLGIINQD